MEKKGEEKKHWYLNLWRGLTWRRILLWILIVAVIRFVGNFIFYYFESR